MKTILINGSPNPDGATATALRIVANSLAEHGVTSELVQIGRMELSGCIACGACLAPPKSNSCVHKDGLSDIAEKIYAADGLVVGSPVYYAGINGTVKSFLDRLFYSGTGKFRFKVAAGVVAMRRAGGTAALQTINHYFQFAEMLIVPTMYWSGIHGKDNDLEAVQMLEVLGRNMAYLMRMKAESYVPVPEPVVKVKTHI